MASGATLSATQQGTLGVGPDETSSVPSFEIAQSPCGVLRFTNLAPSIDAMLHRESSFAVISTLTDRNGEPLFGFADPDDEIEISKWIFSLSPAGLADPTGNPPILIFKSREGSVPELAQDISLWTNATELNSGSYTPDEARVFIQRTIGDAKQAVAGDPKSLYAAFVNAVIDPSFVGILALNCNLKLSLLPSSIQTLLCGLTKQVDGKTVSNIDNFRAHHIGIQFCGPPSQAGPQPTIRQSSFFGLVDYEKPAADGVQSTAAPAPPVPPGFEVEYLRALFSNSALTVFQFRTEPPCEWSDIEAH